MSPTPTSKGCPHRWCVSPKGCPCCHHIPEGVKSQRAPKGMFQWQSCGIQRDASASGVSSKECPWCHRILKRLSLLPACPPTVTTVTCTPGTHSWCVPIASLSPMSAPRHVPKMMCLPPPCPKTEVPTAGVTTRGCLCCHHVPRGMHPLPWSVLKDVPL